MLRVAFICLSTFLLATTANAQNAKQIESVSKGKSCVNCNLFQADLSNYELPGLNLSGSRLRQSNLALAQMNGCNFSGADLSIAYMFGGRFTDSNFKNTNLERASLVGTYFGHANLTGASLKDAVISGAEMENVIGLTQAQLDLACGDETTKLPAGLSVKKCTPKNSN